MGNPVFKEPAPSCTAGRRTSGLLSTSNLLSLLSMPPLYEQNAGTMPGMMMMDSPAWDEPDPWAATDSFTTSHGETAAAATASGGERGRSRLGGLFPGPPRHELDDILLRLLLRSARRTSSGTSTGTSTGGSEFSAEADRLAFGFAVASSAGQQSESRRQAQREQREGSNNTSTTSQPMAQANNRSSSAFSSSSAAATTSSFPTSLSSRPSGDVGYMTATRGTSIGTGMNFAHGSGDATRDVDHANGGFGSIRIVHSRTGRGAPVAFASATTPSPAAATATTAIQTQTASASTSSRGVSTTATATATVPTMTSTGVGTAVNSITASSMGTISTLEDDRSAPSSMLIRFGSNPESSSFEELLEATRPLLPQESSIATSREASFVAPSSNATTTRQAWSVHSSTSTSGSVGNIGGSDLDSLERLGRIRRRILLGDSNSAAATSNSSAQSVSVAEDFPFV